MNTILLIRHGMTKGNRERRYIGRTDEPLCEEGLAQARQLAKTREHCHKIFVSPYIRCIQTAQILFGGQDTVSVYDLRECNFGVFEGRTADELERDSQYAAWFENRCRDPIPGGEDVTAFKERCCLGFQSAVGTLLDGEAAAFVIHGGCIMAILERYALPVREFYEYQVRNCQMVVCGYDGKNLFIQEGAPC